MGSVELFFKQLKYHFTLLFLFLLNMDSFLNLIIISQHEFLCV